MLEVLSCINGLARSELHSGGIESARALYSACLSSSESVAHTGLVESDESLLEGYEWLLSCDSTDPRPGSWRAKEICWHDCDDGLAFQMSKSNRLGGP